MESKPRWWQSTRDLSFLGAVAATLVATGIIAFVPAASSVREWLGHLWSWLTGSLTVPAWLVLAGAGGLVLICYVVIRVLLKSKTDPEPAWLSYTAATFLDIDWRWHYEGRIVSGLTPYCPDCKTGIRPTQHGSYGRVYTTVLKCEECQFVVQFTGRVGALFDRIERLIEREVRIKLATLDP